MQTIKKTMRLDGKTFNYEKIVEDYPGELFAVKGIEFLQTHLEDVEEGLCKYDEDEVNFILDQMNIDN